ncbi:MAG: type II secretion system protein GspD, partial [Rhodanobacter sp.]
MLRKLAHQILCTGTLAAAVCFAGCASLPKPPDDGALQREAMAGTQNPVPAPLPLTNDISDNAGELAAKSEVTRGSGQFIRPAALKTPRLPVAGSNGVTFNFENQPVQAVVKAILG